MALVGWLGVQDEDNARKRESVGIMPFLSTHHIFFNHSTYVSR